MNDQRSALLGKSDGEDMGHPSISQVIYQKLHDKILSGSLAPGTLLRQEELAAGFSSSRVPLREALSRLEAEGLVKLRPRRGYIVSSLDPQEIIELLQLRIVVEEHAGYVATLSRSQKDVVALSESLKRLELLPTDRLDEEAIKAWVRENRVFHDLLAKASGRTHLRQVIANLHAKIGRYIEIELAIGPELAASQADHRAIVHAFVAGDARAVAELCRRHCETTAERFARALQSEGLTSSRFDVAVLDYRPPQRPDTPDSSLRDLKKRHATQAQHLTEGGSR